MENLSSVTTYEELVAAIRKVRSQSRERVEQAVEAEKVREAWETGKLIDKHILLHKERADYGKKVVIKLAQDLDMSETELKFMVQFARTYPIRPPADELSWAHYRELLSLNEEQERREVTTKAVQQKWTRDQTREEIRKHQVSKKQIVEEIPVPKLTAQLGTLYTYRMVIAEYGPHQGKLTVDLGFANYYFSEEIKKFSAEGGSASGGKEGDMILSENRNLKKIEASEKDLWTYKTYVTEVIDGDTFHAVIDLGFGFTTFQSLRLRGVDAREIQSAEGLEAKQFLEKALQNSPVLIRTVKSDKYDRYLADVFVKGEYINQQLLDAGLATFMPD